MSNHILNITIVDDFLNKREIKANAPSKYMAKFSKTNRELDKTMKTHLIDELDEFGVWEDDYDKFILFAVIFFYSPLILYQKWGTVPKFYI